MSTPPSQKVAAYARDRLRAPQTYAVAFLVGTVINFYGHFFVPWIKNSPSPGSEFIQSFQDCPWLTGLSVGLAYIFPLLVGVYSSVATRFATQQFESRALFPDAKPDPVFRADAAGKIVEMGAYTEALFQKARIVQAQDFVGKKLWDEWQNGEPRQGVEIDSAALGETFLLSTSPGPDGTLNIYASKVAGPPSSDHLH